MNAVVSVTNNAAALAQFTDGIKVNTYRYMSWQGQVGQFSTKDEDRNVIVIKNGSKFVLNLPEVWHGYICWSGGQVKDREFFNLLTNPVLPPVDDLPDHSPYPGDRDGWNMQFSIPLYSQDEKMGYVLNLSGKVATNAFGALVKKIIIASQKAGKDLDTALPVIEIFADKYHNKKMGKDMPVPGFKVVDWVNSADAQLTISGRPPEPDTE